MDNINEKMAKVMGWHKEHCDWFDGMAYVPELDASVLLVNDWHPDTNIEQAIDCADKLIEDGWFWKLLRNPRDYWFILEKMGRNTIDRVSETKDKLPLAICEAIKEAMFEIT